MIWDIIAFCIHTQLKKIKCPRYWWFFLFLWMFLIVLDGCRCFSLIIHPTRLTRARKFFYLELLSFWLISKLDGFLTKTVYNYVFFWLTESIVCLNNSIFEKKIWSNYCAHQWWESCWSNGLSIEVSDCWFPIMNCVNCSDFPLRFSLLYALIVSAWCSAVRIPCENYLDWFCWQISFGFIIDRIFISSVENVFWFFFCYYGDWIFD